MNAMIREEFDAKSARTRQPLPLWAGAFDRATMEHTPEVIGAYMLILMAMWETKSCDLPADEKLLARVARVSPTIWRRRLAPVILPMLSEENSRIFSKKLQENAEKTEEYCRKQHERKSGKNPPKPLKNNKTASTADQSTEQSTEPTGENPKPLTINSKKEEEGAHAREAEFLISVREAVGIDPADIPRFWIGPQAVEHLERWKAMGLTEAEIIAEAKASRGKNPEPPDGPKALDRWMEQAVKAKVAASAPAPAVGKAQAQPKTPMPPEKRLQFFADLINGPGHVPTSMITNTIRDALLAAGLVTPERLRERQIY